MGLALRSRRLRLHLTQKQCADEMGVSTPSYNGWEQGTKWPTPDKLPKLAALLRCSIHELYAPEGEATPGADVPEDAPAHISIPEGGAEDHGAQIQEYL